MSKRMREQDQAEIEPDHTDEFLDTVGGHLAGVAPKFGKITFNFADGYQGFKYERDHRRPK